MNPQLRDIRSKMCRGSLCVHRNGLAAKTRKFVVTTGLSPDHNLGVYNNNVDTIERALTERYFLCKDGEGYRPAFKVGPSAFRTADFSEFGKTVLENMPKLPKLSRQQVVDMYRGGKRVIYQQALLSLNSKPLTVKDSHTSMFVKHEKQDMSKAPRGINPRATRYNLELGRYLKHSEHHFFNAINKAFGARTRATVIKGFNADVSASILHDKWSCFANPVAIGLDASKFDMHVSQMALKYEHEFYKALFPGNKMLKELLRCQLTTRGRAYAPDGRVDFEIEGTRCSGDLNTSLGNCIIMCAMIYVYAKERGVKIELANNGDDCVVFMENEDRSNFMTGLDSWYRVRGFAMTVEKPVTVFEQVEFCQTHPVCLHTGWRMVRNLSSMLRKDPMCLIEIPNVKTYQKWLGAVGQCGTTLCGGVPVANEFYRLFSRHGRDPGKMLQHLFKNRSQLQLAKGIANSSEITPKSRVSYYYAFGVLPAEQIAFEQYLQRFVIDYELSGPINRGDCVLLPGHNIE